MRKFFVIVFLFLFLHVYGQKDYKILSSSNSTLIVEYTPKYLDKSEKLINSSTYLNIDLFNGEIENNVVGAPSIPVRVLNIGVPSEYGNTVSVISSKFDVVKGKLKPMPNVKKIDKLPSFQYIENQNYSNFKNPELVSFGKSGQVRDLLIQQVKFHPVQFDPLNQQIKIFSKIIIQINFRQSNSLSQIKKSDLTKNLVINSEVVNNWGSESKLTKKTSVTGSFLASGDWYQFEAPDEGIYRINSEFLSNMGINADNVDPRTIKIYNNGGYILPWSQSGERPIDLVENAIFIQGEDDGSFDSGDFIIFYGRGVDFWEYSETSKNILRNKHFYSKQNYYWLTFGGEQGKRIETQQNITGSPDYIQSTTRAFKFQDNDNQNLIGSGLLYVEDDYSSTSNSKTYVHTLDGLVNGTEINYKFQFVNGSTRSNLLTIDENGSRIFSRSISGASSVWQDYRYGALFTGSADFNGNLPDSRSVLKFTFNPSSISDKGHLDFIEVEYTQNLQSQISSMPVIFFADTTNAIIQYSASPFNNSNFKVYNITDYANLKIVDVDYNGGGFNFLSSENGSVYSKYIAIYDDEIQVPQNSLKIENSDLRGFQPGAQYIIISHREFTEQAERLYNYRVNSANIKTTGKVAYIDQIYNEFSGGLLDPTAIRDFIKYAYENWQIQPEYVLLFGDGDYDYFDLADKGLNFISTFQSTESLYEINSYPYDDYYSRIAGNDQFADVGIGRLSITSTDEAEIVVDKIITYETELNKGLWRNKITLLADDGLAGFSNGSVTDDGKTHTQQSETLSIHNIPNSFDRNKIYLSNYQTNNTGLGRRKPDCNAAILEAINNGTLIFNYVGHGNPDVWAHENVFDRKTSIPELRNKEYFFLTAATCDFGKYDDPNLQSATEEMILMENAGMIGGLSAVRPVFSGQNAALNQTFYGYMLGEVDSNGFPIPIGKAYHRLKQTRNSDNDEKFHLFADPLLRLNIPKLPVQITSVNDQNLSEPAQVKALSEVTIKGTVLDTKGNNSQFDGEGIITVYDSDRIIRLEDINYDMTNQGGVLFRGRVSVDNGDFATSFTMPKDISYENKNGKIITYFFNDDIDGVGYTDNIIVGGTDSSNTNDGKGPDIEILYDDETESSYLVSPNFKLRVKLFDETGLNTSGTGIGHKLEAIINDDEQNSIDLTNFFIGDLNSGGKSGEVNYNFSSLESGEYKIKINAWDVYNNFSSQVDYFTVVDDNDLVVREVYNYPNPFNNNTYFTFQHNLNDAINVKIKVYTIAGRVVKELESFNIEDKFVKIEWNGRDDDNDKLGNGTYLYKLIVETVKGQYKENILGKMAVIR